MIVIKKLDVVKVPDSFSYRVAHLSEQDYGKISYETVIPQRFVDAYGREVLLGMTKEVEEILGLPMEVYQKQRNQIVRLEGDLKSLRREGSALVKQVSDLTNRQYETNGKLRAMSLWQRVRVLFGGDPLRVCGCS
jgi:hypothetical protein